MPANDKKALGCGPILAGTLLIHPACFALAFAIGFIFGCAEFEFSAAGPGSPAGLAPAQRS